LAVSVCSDVVVTRKARCLRCAMWQQAIAGVIAVSQVDSATCVTMDSVISRLADVCHATAAKLEPHRQSATQSLENVPARLLPFSSS